MNTKKVILISLVALAFLAFFIVSDAKNKSGGGGAISQNILYITQPVMSFSGVVEKIEGNKITVTQKQMAVQTYAPPAIAAATTQTMPSPLPTPKTIVVTFQATVSNNTQISQPQPYINYLFKTVTPAPQLKLSIKDIKVGSTIMVGSPVDLRTISGNAFDATMINLPQKNNMINGQIASVGEDALTIKAYSSVMAPAGAAGIAMAQPKQIEYTIKISSDTEISRMIYTSTPPKSEKLSISDLKKDVQATIYTDADIAQGTSFTALRIEPMISMPAPAMAPIPVVSTIPPEGTPTPTP